MEEEIVDVNVRPKQVASETAIFQNIVRNFQKPGYSYFKTGPSFASLTWLMVGNSEGKKRFCFIAIIIMWNHVIFWMSSHNQ